MVVTIHPIEKLKVEAAGGTVKGGFLQPLPGCRGCQFKDKETYLCNLHGTPAKPFGCIASPFTLNKNDTLVIRNRYRLLKCFNAGPRIPAYRAFGASLRLIFGAAEAARITRHLDNGGGDLYANALPLAYAMLHDNDDAKHKRKKKGGR